MYFPDRENKKPLCLLLSFSVTAIVAVINLRWGNDLYYGKVNNPITLLVGGISGTAFIIGLSQRINCKLFADIGKHTLPIMGTHQLAIYAVCVWLPYIKNGNAIAGLILLTAIIVLEIPTIYLIEKYLPFFVGMGNKRKKNS